MSVNILVSGESNPILRINYSNAGFVSLDQLEGIRPEKDNT